MKLPFWHRPKPPSPPPAVSRAFLLPWRNSDPDVVDEWRVYRTADGNGEDTKRIYGKELPFEGVVVEPRRIAARSRSKAIVMFQIERPGDTLYEADTELYHPSREMFADGLKVAAE